jgi:alkanesulfonate monooxygenase SsuD/methylene tetrahydromethanopterin reductase-like flavin-dependent oxidoreductase (luciferase family)
MIRFDCRCPAFSPAEPTELFQAALDMAEWADQQELTAIVLSEHHGTDDGYLPAPLVMAGAMVGRTRRIPINVAALLVPLHHPVRIAEDLAVLDLLSGGRVSVVAGLGYRPEEYALFDRPWDGRGADMEDQLRTMLAAWTGEPLEVNGHEVRVTPTPASQPHPIVFVGGSTEIAAKRAARLGLHFQPAIGDPELERIYLEECERLGHEPGLVAMPPGAVSMVFVSKDPDALWDEIGPNLLHDTTSYKGWQRKGQRSAVESDASTVEELRAGGLFEILTPDETLQHARTTGALLLHPMCGGIPPEVAWESLRLMESEVLPRLPE